MGFVKTVFWLLILVIGVPFLHYTLPRHEVVRVVNTYQERQDLHGWTAMFWSSPNSATPGQTSHDVQFISTVKADGKPMVFRNEDTGWGWPPYFKFDTASLQTRSDDLKSSPEAPKWAVMTYYGWRSEIFSIFPNAIWIKAVDSKDQTIIPWFNIVFLTALTMLILTIRALWIQFRRRMIEPMLGDVANAIEDVTDRAEAGVEKAKGMFSDK